MEDKRKWILGIVGTLVLGALGSGLWSVAFQPGLTWLARLMMSGATFGITSVHDNIYVGIAKGYRELPGLHALLILNVAALWGFSYLLGSFTAEGKRNKKKAQDLIEKITEGKPVSERTDEERQKIDERLKAEAKRLLEEARQHEANLLLILTLLLVFFTVRYAFISYANSAITHYQQTLTICKPYLSTEQEEQIASQFARIKNRADYVAVMNQLYQVAKTQDVEVPAFDPW